MKQHEATRSNCSCKKSCQQSHLNFGDPAASHSPLPYATDPTHWTSRNTASTSLAPTRTRAPACVDPFPRTWCPETYHVSPSFASYYTWQSEVLSWEKHRTWKRMQWMQRTGKKLHRTTTLDWELHNGNNSKNGMRLGLAWFSSRQSGSTRLAMQTTPLV